MRIAAMASASSLTVPAPAGRRHRNVSLPLHPVTRTIIARGDTRSKCWHRAADASSCFASLGRGATDFDPSPSACAAGLRVLRPQRAHRPQPRSDDRHRSARLCGRRRAVIEHEATARVRGRHGRQSGRPHAATDRPDLVCAVSLVAANVGHAPSRGRARGHQGERQPALPMRIVSSAAIRILRGRQRRGRGRGCTRLLGTADPAPYSRRRLCGAAFRSSICSRS